VLSFPCWWPIPIPIPISVPVLPLPCNRAAGSTKYGLSSGL
jgi:hypothetical protein